MNQVMKWYKFASVMAALLCAGIIHARDFKLIAGQIVDAASGEKLHYASVSLEGSLISNVTNQEGVFTLKIPSDTPESSVISVNLLGYTKQLVTVGEFAQTSQDKPLKIKLISVNLKIDPALIRALDAKEMIDNAVRAIPSNYPQKAVGMTAFYREMVSKGKNRYLVLNEAVIDIEKASYTGIHTDKVGIYKGRGSINYDSSDTLMIKFQGGVNAILQIDQAKNRFLGVEPSELNLFYDFTMGQSELLDQRLFYVVEFEQKESSKEKNDFLYRGKIYIDSESLAIGRIICNMNVEGRPDATSLYVMKRPAGLKVEIKSASFQINYTMRNGLWYYDYASQELKFDARKKYWPFRNNYTIISEIVVTDHKKGEFRINTEQRLKFRDQLSEKVGSFTDVNFWENYNVIEPDQSIELIIKKIIKQLKRRNDEVDY